MPSCVRAYLPRSTRANQPYTFLRSVFGASGIVAGPRGGADGKPDFIAGCCAIDPLKHQFEIEAKLQLADDDKRRFIAPQGHQIATADFPLHVEAETLEKALHRRVKRGLSVVG